MARRSSSRKGVSRVTRKIKHVYFESKEPGRDSWYGAVIDRGRKGVDSPREVREIAAAQLADLIDLKTIDNTGKGGRKGGHGEKGSIIKWNLGLWSGRCSVLWKLYAILRNKGRLKGKAEKELHDDIRKVQKEGYKIMKIKSKEERLKKVYKILTKDLGLSESQAKEIIIKTNPGDRTIEKLLDKL